jgi:hypothetical protein
LARLISDMIYPMYEELYNPLLEKVNHSGTRLQSKVVNASATRQIPRRGRPGCII